MNPSKKISLETSATRHRKPENVRDPLFAEQEFFDPEDLVQVKYEMLRRAGIDRCSVTETAATFGFSRPAFYAARERLERHGLAGLVPQRPGPKGGHKLTEEVVDFLEATLAGEESDMASSTLAERVDERFAIRVHPRSIERALVRRRKKNSASGRRR